MVLCTCTGNLCYQYSLFHSHIKVEDYVFINEISQQTIPQHVPHIPPTPTHQHPFSPLPLTLLHSHNSFNTLSSSGGGYMQQQQQQQQPPSSNFMGGGYGGGGLGGPNPPSSGGLGANGGMMLGGGNMGVGMGGGPPPPSRNNPVFFSTGESV